MPRHPDSEYVASRWSGQTRWIHASVDQWLTEHDELISRRLHDLIEFLSSFDGHSIGDMLAMSDRELLRLPGFGKASLREFRALTQPTPVESGPQRDWLLVPRSPAALRSRR